MLLRITFTPPPKKSAEMVWLHTCWRLQRTSQTAAPTTFTRRWHCRWWSMRAVSADETSGWGPEARQSSVGCTQDCWTTSKAPRWHSHYWTTMVRQWGGWRSIVLSGFWSSATTWSLGFVCCFAVNKILLTTAVQGLKFQQLVLSWTTDEFQKLQAQLQEHLRKDPKLKLNVLIFPPDHMFQLSMTGSSVQLLCAGKLIASEILTLLSRQVIRIGKFDPQSILCASRWRDWLRKVVSTSKQVWALPTKIVEYHRKPTRLTADEWKVGADHANQDPASVLIDPPSNHVSCLFPEGVDYTEYDDPTSPKPRFSRVRWSKDISQVLGSQLDPYDPRLFCEYCGKGSCRMAVQLLHLSWQTDPYTQRLQEKGFAIHSEVAQAERLESHGIALASKAKPTDQRDTSSSEDSSREALSSWTPK